MKGTIARWFDHRGFGFISVDGQPNDIFVHVTDMNDYSSPQSGDTVEFDVSETNRGPRAINVKPTSA
ncbi:MAG: cold shock domain-containing protein [Candidatus Bathyarchaeota archaeon]|nr:MAG: cold shock domain-containing protein [Candidatus Bathyarchaeota archaeon]